MKVGSAFVSLFICSYTDVQKLTLHLHLSSSFTDVGEVHVIRTWAMHSSWYGELETRMHLLSIVVSGEEAVRGASGLLPQEGGIAREVLEVLTAICLNDLERPMRLGNKGVQLISEEFPGWTLYLTKHLSGF